MYFGLGDKREVCRRRIQKLVQQQRTAHSTHRI